MGKRAFHYLKKFKLSTLMKEEKGFTYVEIAIVMTILTLLIPAIFSFEYGLERQLKKGFYRQQLGAEIQQFVADVRDEIRQGQDFRLSNEGWLLFDLPSGETVRYKQDKRRLLRGVRSKEGSGYQGTTILLQDAYWIGFEPDQDGVWFEVGLQNWHSDLKVRRYFRGRSSL
ncbi:hypothetical protein SAMN05444972_10819 [Marininema halotolerans]|uniref:Prepilin-type N-terminal cleavage/methylation domain-containing protein n=1 Tax=Marininema halotolerans TaxID=1155944 RepID=A0A1I6ST10_9BACL|nr:hypothetical protein SAMN05444972_10819 [Marininema halotolerans]